MSVAAVVKRHSNGIPVVPKRAHRGGFWAGSARDRPLYSPAIVHDYVDSQLRRLCTDTTETTPRSLPIVEEKKSSYCPRYVEMSVTAEVPIRRSNLWPLNTPSRTCRDMTQLRRSEHVRELGWLGKSPGSLFLNLAAAVTIVCGIVYVGGAWTPSHYGIALQKIGLTYLGPSVGTAREVRGDDWAVLTPYFQIAVANDLGDTDEISPYHEPLRSFFALPTRDWSLIFKPQLWGFLVLPPEYAFSLYHFILIASFIWGFSVLFRQVRIPTHWALLGALLIFFSRFVQVWWTNNAPTFAFAAWPLAAALLPVSIWWRFVLVLYSAAVWLFGLLYVPFIIGAAFALAGLLIALRRDALKISILLPAGCATAAAIVIVAWYFRELIPIMQNTVHPGSRISEGGSVSWIQVLSHVLPYITARQFAPTLPDMNECEVGVVASYLPLLLLIFVDHRMLVKQLRTELWTAGVLGACILLTLAWLVLPLPAEVGRIFLWDRVPPWRLLWAFGLLTSFASLWLASIAHWRVSMSRGALFLSLTGAAWIGTKNGALAENWFDGVILITVTLSAAFILLHPSVRNSNHKGILLTWSVVLTSMVTFGTFNPLQSAYPIFHRPDNSFVDGLRRLAQPRGWVAVPGWYGAMLTGLGLRSINHTLLRPQLDFFRPFFPSMAPAEFNSVFNRYMHAAPASVSAPRIFGPYREDHVLLPIMIFGTPLRVLPITEPEPSSVPKRGQIENVRLETQRDSWKAWIEGWVPLSDMAAEQEIEVFVPDEFKPALGSIHAVRNFRPDLTKQTVGGEFSFGGFIVEVSGAGNSITEEALGRGIRLFSKDENGKRFEAKRAPSNEVLIMSDKKQFLRLPTQGHVDELRLEDNGSVLTVSGWIATNEKKSVDQLALYFSLSTSWADTSWTNRPDVVRAGAALDLLTGFKITIGLEEPLQAIPAGASLCIAGISDGEPVARASDHHSMACR
jgi:hypothetical protein